MEGKNASDLQCGKRSSSQVIPNMVTETAGRSYADLWRKYDAVEQRLSKPLTDRMLDLANLQPGMHLLDVASGRGEPAIPAAQRVLPHGTVLGVDIDNTMLSLAQEKADREGLENVEFCVSDLETQDSIPQGLLDVAFCRWGLMYFQQPVTALHIIRRALKASGMFVAALWVDPDGAPFYSLPRDALSKVAAVPLNRHDAPGTFYYSENERLSQDMEAAGFIIRHSELLYVDVIEVSSDRELIDWALAFGMSRLVKDLSMEKQTAWKHELVSLAEDYRVPSGHIRLGGVSRIIVAEKIADSV